MIKKSILRGQLEANLGDLKDESCIACRKFVCISLFQARAVIANVLCSIILLCYLHVYIYVPRSRDVVSSRVC